MSLTPRDSTASINNQAASRLFQLPVEIRRCIYHFFINEPGYHVVSSTDGDLALTPCLGPDLYDGNFGQDRDVPWESRLPHGYRICSRRLRSSWGPHWMCEEFWMGGAIPIVTRKGQYGMDVRSLYPVLRICKRMHEEVMTWVTADADFHVVDLETLEILERNAIGSLNFGVQAFMSRIEKLSIFLSRPLSFFRTLETTSLVESSPPVTELESDASIWIYSTRNLCAGFPHLRKILLWLDHTGNEYWSVVNERAVLAAFLSGVADCHSADYTVVLPKAHPKIANRDQHFLQNSIESGDSATNSLPVAVRRVMRQRKRVRGGPNGHEGRTTWVQDFPHLLDCPLFEEWDMARIEDMETIAWLNGHDICADLRASGYHWMSAAIPDTRILPRSL